MISLAVALFDFVEYLSRLSLVTCDSAFHFLPCYSSALIVLRLNTLYTLYNRGLRV